MNTVNGRSRLRAPQRIPARSERPGKSAKTLPVDRRLRKVAADGLSPTDLGVLDIYIGFGLRLAQDASFRAYAKAVGEPNLKAGRFAAMMVISRNPGISPIALSRAIARDKSTMTPLIQNMERHGLVERKQSAADRRSVSLTLTKAGEAVLEKLWRTAEEHDRKLDAIIGPRKAELLEMLRLIADEIS